MFWRTTLAFLLIGTPLAAQGNGDRDKIRELDAYFAKAAKDWNVPGLAIGIVHKGQLVFAKGYGVADVSTKAPVDTQTIFAIASTTKAITAAALGMLVDEGKVRWDDPVTKYVPTFEMYDPWATREATVRDLITHRGGLPNADYLWTHGDNSRDEVIRRIRFIKPTYSFRGGYVYHNVMYTVAGAVIEAASGMTWDAFLQQRLFQPLGMTRSVTTLVDAKTKGNRAEPHGRDADTLRVSGNSLADGIGPGGVRVVERGRHVEVGEIPPRFGQGEWQAVAHASDLGGVVQTGDDPAPVDKQLGAAAPDVEAALPVVCVRLVPAGLHGPAGRLPYRLADGDDRDQRA